MISRLLILFFGTSFFLHFSSNAQLTEKNTSFNLRVNFDVQRAVQRLHSVYSYKLFKPAQMRLIPRMQNELNIAREKFGNIAKTPDQLFSLATDNSVYLFNGRLRNVQKNLWMKSASDCTKLSILSAGIVFSPYDIGSAEFVKLFFGKGVCSYKNFALALLSVGVHGLKGRKHKLVVDNVAYAEKYILNNELNELVEKLRSAVKNLHKEKSKANVGAFLALQDSFDHINLDKIPDDDVDSSGFRSTRYLFYTLQAAYIGACTAIIR